MCKSCKMAPWSSEDFSRSIKIFRRSSDVVSRRPEFTLGSSKKRSMELSCIRVELLCVSVEQQIASTEVPRGFAEFQRVFAEVRLCSAKLGILFSRYFVIVMLCML